MTALKIERIGDHLGVTLPREVVEKLGLGPDGSLFLTEQTPGDFRLTTRNPETARQVELGRQIMRDFADTFKALAK